VTADETALFASGVLPEQYFHLGDFIDLDWGFSASLSGYATAG
jgi:hypothetical protein